MVYLELKIGKGFMEYIFKVYILSFTLNNILIEKKTT